MTRRSSVPIVGALVVSILGAGVTRSLVVGQRQRLEVARGTSAAQGTNLSNLNSFALGLLLGGLRGPLVMALWTSSENQKTEKNLEDFDTKVELIRLLQPEFDTVHLFQVWNKAYNISVQMANIPNKYTTILDALAYAASVDRERPNDINMLAAIGGLYFDKFGGAAEKAYFSTRLQAETLPVQDRLRVTFPAASRTKVLTEARLAGATNFMLSAYEADGAGERYYLSLPKAVGDALRTRLTEPGVEFTVRPATKSPARETTGHPDQHRSLLDTAYDILPALLEPRGGHARTGDAADGSELPYLPEFQPFPYGVSPYALSYDYYKRCQWLQINRGARHAQLADRVLSSRVAMSLEKWAEEEWYAADRCEINLAGRAVPAEESQLQTVTADLVAATALPDCPLFDQAIWRFNNASRVAMRTAAEYDDHLKTFPEDEVVYRSHIRDVTARAQLTAADALYLQVLRAAPGDKAALAKRAADHYARAASLYSRYLMRYFMDDDEGKQVLPQDYRQLRRVEVDLDDTPERPQRLRDDEIPAALARMKAMHVAAKFELANSIDFVEIDTYIERCYARLRSLALVQ